MMIKKLKNNFGLKLLAFLFAFMLWLIVVNIDDPVMTKTFTNIPVTVEHSEILTEQNKTYQIVDDTQNVSVVVSAKRRTLSKIKASDLETEFHCAENIQTGERIIFDDSFTVKLRPHQSAAFLLGNLD